MISIRDMVTQVGFVLCVVISILSDSEVEGTCGYQGCPKTKAGYINVHLIPHSHDDVGWLKTVDQYYYGDNSSIQQAAVQYTLDSVVGELQKNPDRRFIFVETGFFWRWWTNQDEAMQQIVRRLVNNGQLEFILGGWVMNDEACAHYSGIIDQMTLGLRFLNDTFGQCGIPKVAWQIDPFGHSREQASLFAKMGYDGLFFGRLDYQDKEFREKNKEMEMIWSGSPNNLGSSSWLFTGALYNGYNPPDGFCFDVFCSDDPINDDPKLLGYNVEQKVNDFIKIAKEWAEPYDTDHVLMTMGSDFQYMCAGTWYKNLDKLIKYVNRKQITSNSRVNVLYSTPSCYIQEVHKSRKPFPVKTDDFFPYASDPHAFWTGYFSSRPTFKYFVNQANNFLQVCKQLAVGAYAGRPKESLIEDVNKLSEPMAIAQHHDAVSGTAKQHVTDDYSLRLSIGLKSCDQVIDKAFRKLQQKTSRSSEDQNPESDESPPHHSAYTPTYQFCHLLNISACLPSEEMDDFIVSIYNPLARDVQDVYIRIPVTTPSWDVQGQSERRRIGQAHFYPYFVAFVGEAYQSYDKDSDICKSCHAKVMTSRRTNLIEIPGKRLYQTVLSESSVDAPLSKTRRGLTYGVELLGRTGAPSLGDENVDHVDKAYNFSDSDPRSTIDTFRPPKETRPRTDEAKQFQFTKYRSQLDFCSESSESSMELSASAGFFGQRHRTTEAIGSSAVRQSVLLESSSSSEGLSQLSSRDLSQHSVFSGYNFRLYRNPPSVESQNNSSTSHSESSILSSQASLPPSNATPQSLISNTSMNTNSQASLFSSTTQSEQDYEDDDCVHLLNVQACSYSESCCVVCQSESGRSRIPSTAFNQVYKEKNIFIPPGNRTCEHHLQGRLFTSSALDRIIARMSTISVPKEKFGKWMAITFSVSRGVSPGPLDFSTAELDDDTCLTLLGVIGKDFLCLYSHISTEMRISNNRHPINSLAMLLILLRLNISQDAVGKLFGLTQRLVSDNVSTVAKLLDRKFVNENLGFSHMPFEKVITSHNRKTFTTALVIPEDSLVLIQDGTYVYVEKSMNHAKQRETYSGQKKRNFIKPMMSVLPSGYILDVQGPFSAVSNDASILNLMLHPQHTSGFWDYVQKSSNPHLILDRGFRDSKDAAREAFVEIRMPKFLNNACQFTVRESNESRVVTFLRWVVEVANGRVSSQITYIPPPVLDIPGRLSKALYELVFAVDVLPGLTLTNFQITRNTSYDGFSNLKLKSQLKAIKKGGKFFRQASESSQGNSRNVNVREDFMIKNSNELALVFDSISGLLKSVITGGVEVPVHQNFYRYLGMAGNNSRFNLRASGAYIFRPKTERMERNQPKAVTERVFSYQVYEGPLVTEVHQVFTEWISQVVRLYHKANLVEFEWLIGPVPIEDEEGKEIVTRFTTDIPSRGVFFTDANGRQLVKRKRDTRETWPYRKHENVSGNYYPVNSRILISSEEDLSQNGRSLVILNDRSQGGSSMNDGEVELMLHRRLLHDDAFGVGEALNETAFGEGLVARGRVWMLVAGEGTGIPLSLHRETAQNIFMNKVMGFADVGQLEKMEFSFMRNSVSMQNLDLSPRKTAMTNLKSLLPDNVHLLTLEPVSQTQVILRLEHFYEKGEDTELSKPAVISIKSLKEAMPFIKSMRETSLGGNQWIEDMKRFQWTAKPKFGSTGIPVQFDDGPSNGHHQEPNSDTIVLQPMEIKTFLIQTA